MKLFIASDSHGHMGYLNKAAALVRRDGYDAVIHLGDFVTDAEYLGRETGIPVYYVAGNCDIYSDKPREIVFRLGGRKILLVHGDRQRVKNGTLELFYAAEQAGCSHAFYGHTHVQSMTENGGITLVNPGALNNGWYAEAEETDIGLVIRLDNLGA